MLKKGHRTIRNKYPAKYFFRRNTLCISRKKDKIGAQKIRKMPKLCGVPHAQKKSGSKCFDPQNRVVG